MPPCNTVFPGSRPKGCEWALGGDVAARPCVYISMRPPATHGVIDGSIYPLPDKETLYPNKHRRKVYEQEKVSKIYSVIAVPDLYS